ncbi:MAG: UpxY family transcription antiterminator [Chitinophagaceae bacterium]
METNKQWYAVYTRPRWEKKVASLLTRKKVDNFCPLNKVVKQWADRKKIIEEPLFTSYVFVYTSIADQLAVRQTDGVLNFVYWLGKPAVIKDKEIDTIKSFLQLHKNVQLEKIDVSVNDQIRVVGGPLMMREGEIIEVKNKTVKVRLPSLGYAMYAEVEKSNVEILNLSQPYLTNTYYNAALS